MSKMEVVTQQELVEHLNLITKQLLRKFDVREMLTENQISDENQFRFELVNERYKVK